SRKILAEAIYRAKEARLKILEIMHETIPGPRGELSKYAPRIETIKINPEKIGALIGPGGKTIKGIVAETGAEINIEDDGSVHIYATNGESMARAKEIISGMTREIEIGQTYQGRVVSTKEFGAFVEVFPGKDGLVHISELADFRVKRTEDALSLEWQRYEIRLSRKTNRPPWQNRAGRRSELFAATGAGKRIPRNRLQRDPGRDHCDRFQRQNHLHERWRL